nr:hypothetical protein [Allomuricauda sp.]
MAFKIKWNSERILSLSAMLISFITLIIFIYQTNLMSRQNYLSILPYLSLSTSNNAADDRYSLSIDNFGVGPAIIESVVIKHKGETFNMADFDNEVLTFLKTRVPALDSIKGISYATLDKGMAIPANASYNILEVKSTREDYLLLRDSLNQLLEEGMFFEIIYRSIQDERWMITNDTEGPEKLN